MKKLSVMVNEFMIKWLLLPSLIFIIGFSFFWTYIEINELKKLHLHYVKDIGRHITAYLNNCSSNLEHAKFHLGSDEIITEAIKDIAGSAHSFNTICLLDENMTTLKSVPNPSFKGDFSGLVNLNNNKKSFFLTSPYYSIPENKTSLAMIKQFENNNEYILAELNLSYLDNYIKSLSSPIKHCNIYLTDHYGNLLSHSETILVNSRTNLGDMPIIKKLKNKERTSGFYKNNGKYNLLSAAKIPSADWIVVMEQNAQSILTPFFVSGILILIIVIILFYTFISLFNKKLYKSVVSPVTLFADKIEFIKNSEKNISFISEPENFENDTFKELSELNQSFFKMHKTIDKREKDLKESEEKYKAIVEDNPILICSFLPDGTITFANTAYCRYFNITHEEITGRNFLEFIPEKDREIALNNLSFLTPDLPVHQTEHRVIDPDGKIRWQKWTDRAIFDNSKNLVSFQSIGEDITERKSNEEKLAAERERLAVTLRSIGDGVITTDTEGKIVLLNKVAEKLTGWKLEEARGKNLTQIFNIINEETGLPHANPVKKVLLTGEIVELENHTLLISKTGEKKVIADSGAPIKDSQSNTIGVVLVFRDMTEKKKLNETLEKTSRLESLGVLAGGIAHDFNNLLGGIFGYIDLALQFSKDEKVKEFLNNSMDAMDRAKNLTGQLLTFSKGGDPLKEPGHLFPFVKKTAEFALSGSNIKCRFKVPSNLYMCSFDKNQIAQVIENLVINAKQAMPLGGELDIEAENIFLKTHPLLSPGNYVKISVKDTGTGIPLKIKPKIFDPFFTTRETGHGIGLTTSYSIIEKHGGTIEVESEQGKGSLFQIYLPSSQTQTLKTLVEKNQENHSGSGLILIIDDEELLLNMTSAMLETLGYKSKGIKNPKEAISFFKTNKDSKDKISAIICDLTIPGQMSGVETAAELRKIDKNIPIFVASGYSEDPVMTNPSEYGFTQSIPKPFKRTELAKLLDTNLPKD